MKTSLPPSRRLHAASLFLAAAMAFGSGALHAKDSLGMYGEWGAFRDPGTPRCYAIAKPAPSTLKRDYAPYATVATWPGKSVRNQVYFRLSRKLAKGKPIHLVISGRRFAMTGSGGGAWAPNKTGDAAITAAMRSAGSMTIAATDSRGQRFSNTYDLSGAATAIDAALVGCAR